MEQNLKHSERGNALWFILVVIVLAGALTMIISRSSSDVDQSASTEQLRLKAGQMIRYAKSIELAIDQMKTRGISENAISFQNDTTATDYTNPSCLSADCKIFDKGGGAVIFKTAPDGANDGSDWIFTGANNVGSTAGPVGTTADGSGNDLIIVLPKVGKALCKQINKETRLNTAGVIPEESSALNITPFTGVYPDSLVPVLAGDSLELDNKRAGCFKITASSPEAFYFYSVLLAR